MAILSGGVAKYIFYYRRIMIFQDRKTKYQQIDLVDEEGEVISGERYFAKITTPNEAVEQDGTPLNADNMNKLCQISIGVSDEEVLEAGVLGYDADTRVLKVGDGESKWQELEGIKRDINEDVWTYYANGENDNLTLPAMVSEIISDSRLPSNACIKLKVCGVLGVNLNETLLDGNINERTNPKSIFTFEVIDNSADRRVEIDWSDAIIPQITTSTQSSGSLYMAVIRTKSSKISHVGGKIDFTFAVADNYTVNAYGYFGDGINYEKCEANVNSTSKGTGQSAGGYTYGFVGNNCKLNRCKSNTSQVGAGGCSGYYGNNNRYTFCEAVSISDTGAGYGFYNNGCAYVHCKALGKGGAVSYGYRGDDNVYDCSEATALRQGDNYVVSIGFKGDRCIYRGCKAYAENKYGYGFSGANNRYVSCNATGVGMQVGNDTGIGVGYYGHNSHLIGCEAIGITPSGLSAAGYKSNSDELSTYHVIKDCIFPLPTKEGYAPTTTNINAINMQTNTNSGVYIAKGNLIDNRLTAICAPAPDNARYIYTDNVVLLNVEKNLD